MFIFKKIFIALAAIIYVSACTAPTPPPAQEINFTKSPVINVNVANIEVVEAYKSPFIAPNIEHLMPYSPADAMNIWVKDRLRAVGSDKLLQITIVDASVIAKYLPKTQSIKGLFTIDQEKKYDARLEVEMKIYGGATLSEANTSVIVTRSITIPENASVNYRKAAYIQMIHEMMKMMNDKLENNMFGYMGNYINISNK